MLLRHFYSIKLATYFWAEHLLDRDHYMDWLLTSLETTQQDALPTWVLITQIYYRDLLKYRKHGRRLSSALLEHMSQVSI